jgi:heptaprenyl diphosphate synthase
MRSMRRAAKKEECIAFLAGVALFLSIVEYALPRPVPFFRLGIANLPVMFAVRLLDAPSVILLVCVKVIALSFLQGTLISYVFLFSALGSLGSAAVMIALFRLFGERISFVGLGVSGALASNLIQIVLARFLVFGDAAWLIAPPFLIVGIVSSTLLGLAGNFFYSRSKLISLLGKELSGPGHRSGSRGMEKQEHNAKRRKKWKRVSTKRERTTRSGAGCARTIA